MPTIFTFTAALLLTLPWLNPFAPGPSPAVAPWLFSMAILAGVLLIFAVRSGWLPASLNKLPGEPPDELSRAFGWSLLAAGLISSVVALLQYFDIEAMVAPWINATEPGYAFANLRQRNQFASLTNLALAVLLVWAMRREAAAAKTSLKLAALAGATLLAIGNAASSSRTGAVQIVLLCMLFALWGGWRHRLVQMMLATAVLAYAAAAVALPYAAGFDWLAHGLFARLQNGDAPCASRITLWSNVLHLIAQKPWLGWGWGELDYAHFITLYKEPRFCDILDNAHNLPLHLAVELGVPFAGLVCVGFVWRVLKQKPWAERDSTRQLAWAVLALMLLHSMLEYPLWYGPFQIAVAGCAYALWPRRTESLEFKQKQPVAQSIRAQADPVFIASSAAPASASVSVAAAASVVSVALVASIALVSMALLAYAAWDYRRVSQIYLAPQDRSAAYHDDTVAKMRRSRLFADQARFAELLLTPVTRDTAASVLDAAERALHYSPEPRVIEKAIESAVMLGRDDEAIAYLASYRAAFPAEHARWAFSNAGVR